MKPIITGVYRSDIQKACSMTVISNDLREDPINRCHSVLEYANYLKYNSLTDHETGELRQNTRSPRFLQEVDGIDFRRDLRTINRIDE